MIRWKKPQKIVWFVSTLYTYIYTLKKTNICIFFFLFTFSILFLSFYFVSLLFFFDFFYIKGERRKSCNLPRPPLDPLIKSSLFISPPPTHTISLTVKPATLWNMDIKYFQGEIFKMIPVYENITRIHENYKQMIWTKKYETTPKYQCHLM